MNTHKGLIKLLIDAVVNGNLVLNEKNGRVRFELRSEICSVKGVLFSRWDWSNTQGRPGLMSMIEQVEFDCSKTTYLGLFDESPEYEEKVTCLLQERLAPERLYKHDVERGWLLTAFNSPTHYERDETDAYSPM
ncbi:hypothetical protein [Ruegeria faecimaris]|uniref:hypothetical protein n=1 Tax=Ruegeria faecimaris TaxID=686389 RepID=UPI00249358F2|nr:hypothetical protein [Ruegeria faecimaris]